MEATEGIVHAIDGAAHLIEVADVGAEAKSGSAGVFDFEFGEVEFGLAAGEEADLRSRGSKANGETFADAATGSRDEDGFLPDRFGEPGQMSIMQLRREQRAA